MQLEKIGPTLAVLLAAATLLAAGAAAAQGQSPGFFDTARQTSATVLNNITWIVRGMAFLALVGGVIFYAFTRRGGLALFGTLFLVFMVLLLAGPIVDFFVPSSSNFGDQLLGGG